MSEIVPIDPIANQTIDIVFDRQRYRLRLHTSNDNTAIDIVLNDVAIVSSQICPSSSLLILYKYARGAGGDFAFLTQNDDVPTYSEFGNTQFLMYYTPIELADKNA